MFVTFLKAYIFTILFLLLVVLQKAVDQEQSFPLNHLDTLSW